MHHLRRTAAATLALACLAVAAAVPATIALAGVVAPHGQDSQVQVAKKGSFDITEIDGAETP